MWKIHDFSVTQILCEISIDESRSSKNAVSAILGALNSWVHLNFQKTLKLIISIFRACKSVLMAFVELLDSQKLISCKI